MKKSVALIVYYFGEFNMRAPPSSLASLASVLVVMVLSKYSMAGFTRSSRTVMETAFKQEEIELGENPLTTLTTKDKITNNKPKNQNYSKNMLHVLKMLS